MFPYLIIIHEVKLFFQIDSHWYGSFFFGKEIKSEQKKANNKNNKNDAGEYISWL